MKIFFKNFGYLLSSKNKNIFIVLCFMSLVGATLETISVGIIFPFLNLLTEAKDKSLFDNFQFDILEKFDNFFSINSNYNLEILSVILILFIVYFKNIYLIVLNWITFKFSLNLENDLSKKLFNLYLHQPYDFFLNRNSSKLIININNEVQLIKSNIINPIFVLFVDFFTILLIITLLIIVNPISSISIFTLMSMASFLYVFFTRKKINIISIERQINESKRLKTLQHSLNGIKEIKIANSENFFSNIFKIHNEKTNNAKNLHEFLSIIPKYILEIFAVTCLFSAFFLLFVYQNLEFNKVIPLLGLYGVAAFKVLPSVNRIIQAINIISFGQPSLNLVANELRNLKKETQTLNKLKLDITSFKDLTIEKLNFYYDKKKRIFHDLNLTINKGDIIGIIGESGSGKSTFVDLITGILKPISGNILVNKKKIHENLGDWQKLIGYVPQEIFILDDTILNNISYGKEIDDTDIREIKNLIKLVDLEQTIIKLPNKYETSLKERGLGLSGGQKQRVGIARALFQKPSFIILDEATNALDKKLEFKIVNNIKKIKEVTILLISHNIETIKSECNKIIEIQNNKVSIIKNEKI